MSNNTFYANTDTPKPGSVWLSYADGERLALVSNRLGQNPQFATLLAVVEAKSDGQVIVKFLAPVAADKRGGILLDFEEYLKNSIDQGLAVWLEPLGDRSSLRNLRGIEVRS